MKIKISNVKTVFWSDKEELQTEQCNIFTNDDIIEKIQRLDENGNPVGEDAAFVPQGDYYEISGKNRLAMPGLINAHTHAYMTIFRNVADDVPFSTWLFDTILPMEDRMTPEDAYFGSLLGNIEMIRTGTTAYLDMNLNVYKCAEAAKKSGMRAVLSRGLVGEEADDEGGHRRLNEALSEWKDLEDGDMTSFVLAPHAPYSCGPGWLKYVAEVAKEKGIGIHTHLAEGLDEINGIKEKYGMTPIEYADNAGIFDVHCVAAHCVHLTDNDFDILKAKNVHVATNPISNMKLANGFANVPEMLKRGINVGIGTDGAASNNALNLIREMSVEALIHKGLTHDAELVSAKDVFKMATLNGAKVLGRNNIGNLKDGMKADIVLLDTFNPAFYPIKNPVSALCYSCSGSEVDTVIVNGKILMEKRELKTLDEENIYYEVQKRFG